MMRKCNICGNEFDSKNDANQCSKECRRTHNAKYVTKESNTPYDVRQLNNRIGSRPGKFGGK